MPMSFVLEIILLGAFVGFILGATGAGGAILSVPLLTVFLHLDISQAGPIGLFAATVVSAIAALMGLREGIVRYKAALLMAGLGLCFAPLGFWLAQRLPNAPLTLIFVVVLAWVGYRMWHESDHLDGVLERHVTKTVFVCERNDVSGKFVWTYPCARALALTGGLAGFLSGLIGVGGGFIIVPSLKKNTNMDMRAIVATSLSVITLVSAGGVALAATHGQVDWSIAVPFVAAAVFGMFGGRQLGHRLPNYILSRGFAVLALVAAGLMLFKLL